MTSIYVEMMQHMGLIFTMPSPLDQPEQTTPADKVNDGTTEQTEVDQPPQPLAIEFGEATQTTNEAPQKLDLGQGDVVKLDALGPMIINTDGVRAYSPIFRICC